MLSKQTNFQYSTKEITYANAAEMFNDLNKKLHGEYYSFAKSLKRPEGGTAVGFVYTGYAAGVGLRNILNTLKINHSTLMKGGSGINEDSEIHIDEEDKKKMLDIIEKIGERKSNLYTEPSITENMATNPLFQKIK